MCNGESDIAVSSSRVISEGVAEYCEPNELEAERIKLGTHKGSDLVLLVRTSEFERAEVAAYLGALADILAAGPRTAELESVDPGAAESIDALAG